MSDITEEQRAAQKSRFNELWEATMPRAIEHSLKHLRESRREAPDSLIHFTDAAGAVGILNDRVLRLCRARSSNDSLEVEYGIGLAKECLSKISNHGETNQIFKTTVLSCLDEEPFHGEIRRIPDPHVCCLSMPSAKTSVPQWGLYGRHGAGIALVFSGDRLREWKEVDLVKVLYEQTVQQDIMMELLETGLRSCIEGRQNALKYGTKGQESIVRIFAHAFGSLAAMVAAAMKHPEFAFEQEWRLSLSDLATRDEKLDERFDAFAAGPIVKTFFKCKIEPPDLMEVLVGPIYADRNVPGLRALLRNKGYNTGMEERVEVRVADVSLRA